MFKKGFNVQTASLEVGKHFLFSSILFSPSYPPPPSLKKGALEGEVERPMQHDWLEHEKVTGGGEGA